MKATEQLVRMAQKLSEQAERIPGASLVMNEYEIVEDAVLQSFHKRLQRALTRSTPMQRLNPPQNLALESEGESKSRGIVIDSLSPQYSPANRLERIMHDALEQSMEEATNAWLHRVLDQLLADEVRILSALSNDDTHAYVNVSGATSLTGKRELLLTGISDVGKAARVKQKDLVPSYLNNLSAMGLVKLGPADDKHELAYQLLEACTEVMGAISEAQLAGYHRVRADRAIIKLAPLGRVFWDLCQK